MEGPAEDARTGENSGRGATPRRPQTRRRPGTREPAEGVFTAGRGGAGRRGAGGAGPLAPKLGSRQPPSKQGFQELQRAAPTAWLRDRRPRGLAETGRRGEAGPRHLPGRRVLRSWTPASRLI